MEWQLPGLGVERNGEPLFDGCRLSVHKVKRVMEMDSGDGCTL